VSKVRGDNSWRNSGIKEKTIDTHSNNSPKNLTHPDTRVLLDRTTASVKMQGVQNKATMELSSAD